MKNILIGFGEALSAPEVTWDLIDHGFNVIAFCRKGSSPPLRHIKEVTLIDVIPPEIDAWETVAQLQKEINSLNVLTVLPLDDASVWLCNEVSKRLDIPIAGGTGDAALLALDKKYQIEIAEKAGFNVPKTQFINGKQDVLDSIEFPVVIKPSKAVYLKDNKLCKGPISFCITMEDYNRALENLDFDIPMIVQPIIAGIGEGIFGISGANGIKQWSAHKRLRMMNPLGSGSSACMALRIIDHPIQEAEAMLKIVKWPGMFMVELLRDLNGKLWFMEFNGRSWGSMALAIRMGLHYPAWTVMQTLDPSFSVPDDTPPWRPITCRHLGRDIIHLLAVLKGKKEYSLIHNFSKMRTIKEVFRFSRNEKFYNWHSGYSHLFWENTIKTVTDTVFSKIKGH